MHTLSKPIFLLGLIGLCMCCGCANRMKLPNPAAAITKRIVPSNNRNWKPEFSRLAWAESAGDQILIRNIRNNQYVTETQFIPGYYDRNIGVDQIQSVDYIVVPGNGQRVGIDVLRGRRTRFDPASDSSS